jgi:PAS domain S-box-containing protein
MHELLVVDDDPASRYATSRLLRAGGYGVREAATGAEGLLYADDSISAMILDVHLPDIDGFALCRLLRSQPHTERLPVLHLTAAYVTDEDKVRGLDAGADAYLTHPVEPAVLVATVHALVRTHSAEQAMRRSEAKFRAVYTHAPSGICLLDDEGLFVDANPAMLAMLGCERNAIRGRRVAEFAPGEWVDRVDRHTRLSTSVPVSEEFALRASDGSLRYVEWTSCPHIEPHLKMGVATDISARIELEQHRRQLLDSERVARGAAERMNRMKDDLIAVLSHELRTPLNAIVGWAQVLRTRGGTVETMRAVNAINENARAQAQLISDILDMSRLNVGKLRLNLEMVDLADIVSGAAETLRPLLEQNEQRLAMEFKRPLRPVHGDAARLQQVVWNLLSNATKFSPPGGEIRISVEEHRQGVRVIVADDGCGIPSESLPFIFDRFAQSASASNRRLGGLGLGLSIVKQLVEAHNGTVSASSEGVGRGAVLEVWLPAADAASSAADAVGAPAETVEEHLDTETSIKDLRLLVVEDDEDARSLLEIILSDRGARVSSASNFDDALALLNTFEPDVLISDIGMPGKDGFQLIREIRQREAASKRRVPAIALTSFTRTQDQAQALAEGYDAHCGKPLQPETLVHEIHRLVGRDAQAAAPGVNGDRRA